MKTLNITLHTNKNTNDIISKLETMGIEKLSIDVRQNLTFIEIETNNFLAFATTLLYDGAIQWCLKIFHWDNKEIEIKIPFSDIDAINRLL